MFIHAVLFEIAPLEQAKYHRDNRLWAAYAKRRKGFLHYQTLKRLDQKNQYASVYAWKSKKDHDQFMDKFHDWLVTRSKAKVRVRDYYNFRVVTRLK
jgi:heme-degrading monooxygenase HmoA